MAKQPTAGRVTHFGQFVRWHRVNAGQTADAYARQLGLTGRRLFAIEAMAVPAVQQTTLAALAKLLGLGSIEALDQAWRSTPVPDTGRRAGPTTETSRRFSAACQLVGIEPTEGLRRLRRWLTEQPPATQRAALAPPPAAPQFTTPVGHRQDPAAAQAARLAAAAALPAGRPGSSRARPPAPAATAGSRRR